MRFAFDLHRKCRLVCLPFACSEDALHVLTALFVCMKWWSGLDFPAMVFISACLVFLRLQLPFNSSR